MKALQAARLLTQQLAQKWKTSLWKTCVVPWPKAAVQQEQFTSLIPRSCFMVLLLKEKGGRGRRLVHSQPKVLPYAGMRKAGVSLMTKAERAC